MYTDVQYVIMHVVVCIRNTETETQLVHTCMYVWQVGMMFWQYNLMDKRSHDLRRHLIILSKLRPSYVVCVCQ